MLSKLTLLATAALTQERIWDYRLKGTNWGNLDIEGNRCGLRNQSPIDLKTSGWETSNISEDYFNFILTDVKNVAVKWDGITSKV